MPTLFKLPDLGENIKSAEVLQVLVSLGDIIQKEQSVVEIESEKATVEVPSSLAGKVTQIHVNEGDTIKPGQVLLTIEEKAGAATAVAAPPAPKAASKVEVKPVAPAAAPVARIAAPAKPAGPPEPPPVVLDKDREAVPASPSVRQFAREVGVDIHNVTGSGPGGRISVEDIKNHVRQTVATRATTAAARPPVELPDFTKFGEVVREPMSGVRRATARHMSLCWSEIPHVTIFERADVTGLDEVRQGFKAKAEEVGGKLTVTALLLKVASAALKANPRVNASLDIAKHEIVFKRYYHIGVAVDTPRGLLVPVLRDVDKKTIIQIAVELTQLSEKARAGKLAPDDMQGASFTVTNLGGLGTTYFTPIVNFPEVAILGVGRATMEPVFFQGSFQPRLLMPLSLSFDHRIVDGADGARFLHWIVEAMEKPLMLSMEG